MNTRMKSFSPLVASTILAAACMFTSMQVLALDINHENPEDAKSNPKTLSYTDVDMRLPDFKAPFVRDGVVTQPSRFRSIVAGLPQQQVRAVLGEPLRQHEGGQGLEWDYNFKMRMVSSENFLVCQYKVVFDAQQHVRETVWRRRQCENLAGGEVVPK